MAAHRICRQCDKRRFSSIRVFRGSIFPSRQCMADNALRCDNYGQPKIRKIVIHVTAAFDDETVSDVILPYDHKDDFGCKYCCKLEVSRHN